MSRVLSLCNPFPHLYIEKKYPCLKIVRKAERQISLFDKCLRWNLVFHQATVPEKESSKNIPQLNLEYRLSQWDHSLMNWGSYPPKQSEYSKSYLLS